MCGCFDLDFGGEYAVIFVFEIGERLGGMVRESRFFVWVGLLDCGVCKCIFCWWIFVCRNGGILWNMGVNLVRLVDILY